MAAVSVAVAAFCVAVSGPVAAFDALGPAVRFTEDELLARLVVFESAARFPIVEPVVRFMDALLMGSVVDASSAGSAVDASAVCSVVKESTVGSVREQNVRHFFAVMPVSCSVANLSMMCFLVGAMNVLAKSIQSQDAKGFVYSIQTADTILNP